MREDEKAVLLAGLAARMETREGFMANVLAAYRAEQGITEEGLRHLLGVSPAMLTRLKMCRRPQASSGRFSEQVREIADYAGADAAVLEAIVRHRVDARGAGAEGAVGRCQEGPPGERGTAKRSIADHLAEVAYRHFAESQPKMIDLLEELISRGHTGDRIYRAALRRGATLLIAGFMASAADYIISGREGGEVPAPRRRESDSGGVYEDDDLSEQEAAALWGYFAEAPPDDSVTFVISAARRGRQG